MLFISAESIAWQYSDSLTAKIQEIFEQADIPGLGVTIFDTENVLYEQGFGYANREEGIPYTAKTAQNVASVSKTFIAVSLMQCIEKGLFTLETPINDLLPFEVINPYLPKEKILIKHLTNHTSGIVDLEKSWKYSYYLLKPQDFEELEFGYGEKAFLTGIRGDSTMSLHTYLKETFEPKGDYYNKKIFKKSAPGEAYEYTNLGANLCAYLIEVATGVSYRNYVIEQIYKPLGMKNSGWSHRLPPGTIKAQTYLASGDPYPSYSDVDYPAGNGATTIADLRMFAQDMMKGLKGDGQLLQKESYEKMLTPEHIAADELSSFAVFWYTNNILKDRMHDGSGGDVAAHMGFNMKEGLGYIMLYNHGLYPEKQNQAQSKIWKTVIKYRQLMAEENP